MKINMVPEYRHGQTVLDMRESSTRMRQLEKAVFGMLMVTFMKEHLSLDRLRVTVHISIRMESLMWEILKMISSMVLVENCGQMGLLLKEAMRRVRDAEMANSLVGVMVVCMRESGKQIR